MNVSEYTVHSLTLTCWVWIQKIHSPTNLTATINQPIQKTTLDLLYPIRQWLNKMEVSNLEVAHSICKLIPAQCPFERDIKFFGRTLLHIPPLCKLNPVYEQVVELRFRALCYLADECGEDVTPYC